MFRERENGRGKRDGEREEGRRERVRERERERAGGREMTGRNGES